MTLQMLQRVGAAHQESGTFTNTSFDLEPETVHSNGEHSHVISFVQIATYVES